jgi:hypothetical protein
MVTGLFCKQLQAGGLGTGRQSFERNESTHAQKAPHFTFEDGIRMHPRSGRTLTVPPRGSLTRIARILANLNSR